MTPRPTFSFVPLDLPNIGRVHACIKFTPPDDINLRGVLPASPEALDLVVQSITDNHEDVLITLREHHAEITA